jgi:3alpha(or 20beta)-hydroxysteroid dehydrogenase
MGRAHTEGFHAAGAKVLITDVSADEGMALARHLGSRAAFHPLDVRDESQWAEAIAAAERHFGPVNVLVNNAGITEGQLTSIKDCEPDRWRNIIDVNLVGCFLGINAVIDSMRRAGSGSIVNVSSVRAFAAGEGRSAYIASKWGLRGLTRAAASELGQYDIRVNSIHPGLIQTPLHADAPERYAHLAIKRVGEPHEVTRMVMYVASDECSYVTGSEFTIDGGFLLHGLYS